MVDDTGTHSPLAQEGVLLLHIAKSSLPGDQNASLVAHSPESDHICLLRAQISEISSFSGNTAKWLMKISKLIFDPLGQGELFTRPIQPMDNRSDPLPLKWVKVQEMDPIKPQIYEYRSDTRLTLAKISLRKDDSRTSKSCRKESTRLRKMLIERDRVCVISEIDLKDVLAVSRLIPKRMADSRSLDIGKRYAEKDNIGRFDPSVAILLNKFHKVWVESYLVGLYHIEGDSYVVHSFYKRDLCIFGYPFDTLPPLHGHLVTLSDHDSGISLPPSGIFDWHYLQCVLARFATDEYRTLRDITEEELPFKTRDDDTGNEWNSDAEWTDSDDEWTDNDDEDLPYPSYPFERHMSQLAEQHETAETNEEIAEWNANVHGA